MILIKINKKERVHIEFIKRMRNSAKHKTCLADMSKI